MSNSIRGPGGRHDNDHPDIAQIRILPTFSEVVSTEKPYLPTTDTTTWVENGMNGILERQFRLFRENAIGPMRDALKSLIQHDTATGSEQRTTVWRGVFFEKIKMDKKTGLMAFEASIPQPPHLVKQSKQARRSFWYNKNGPLTAGTVVAFINQAAKEVLFAEATGPWSDAQDEMQKRTLDGSARVNFQVTSTDLREFNHVVQAMQVFSSFEEATDLKPKTELILLEFPGVLIPGFYHTLEALQDIKRNQNLPLAKYLVPQQSASSQVMKVEFPKFAHGSGFNYDVSTLFEDKEGLENMEFSSSSDLDVARLQNGATSLDDTQATALKNALSHAVALIQGPPGTGKSYTGEKIIDVLLASDDYGDGWTTAGCAPVLCVCYTNHALDQLLENLVLKGIEGVVRIGGQSKSTVLSSRNLRAIAREKRPKKSSDLQKRSAEANELLNGISGSVESQMSTARNGSDKLVDIEAYLRETNYPYLECIFGKFDPWEDDQDVLESNFNKWLNGGSHEKLEKERGLAILRQGDPRAWTHTERQRLFYSWRVASYEHAMDQARKEYEAFGKYVAIRSECRDSADLQVLQGGSVIGVTTSGLARCRKMLQMLAPKVLLIEEAGEILEAHTLTALIPSIEHAILIGDHQQLRPQIDRYDLSSESSEGAKYSLDISLFERLVHPPHENYRKLPYSTLLTQRRMHPDISHLIRETLYPGLTDGANVLAHPPVAGMKHRMFWLDHKEHELSGGSGGTSHYNNFEVEMIYSLVTHLAAQKKYKMNEIAVLTPYLGQLSKLKFRLGSNFMVKLNEYDTEQLKKKERVQDYDKEHLEKCLRVATIDNFQGEEAKVVIISLVRSNPENRVGFLKTTNRINVLLSRAQHGMYIVGNSTTAATVPMWSNVLGLLKKNGQLANHGKRFKNFVDAWQAE